MTDIRPTDPDLEARLRATLTAAAPTDTHVDDGLADLRSRLDGATVVSLRTAPPVRRRGRVALVAAAVALLAAATGAAVVVRDGDDRQELDQSTTTPPEATGWYVPADLPAGWSLVSVGSDHLDVEGKGGTCPCPHTTWSRDDGGLLLLTSAANEAPASAPEVVSEPQPVQLDGGVPAFAGDVFDTQRIVTWAQDGRHHRLYGVRVDAEELIRQAGALAGGPASGRADPATPPGYTLLQRGTVPGGVRAYRAITVSLRHETRDVWATYTLAPAGLGGDVATLSVPEPAQVAGFGGSDLLRYGGIEEAPDASNSVFAGRLPGADLVVGDDPHGRVGDRYPTDADLELLLASLRPVDAEGWRRFVATAAEPADEASVIAPTVADLITPGEAVPD